VRTLKAITRQCITYFLKEALLIIALGLLNTPISVKMFFEKLSGRIFTNPVTIIPHFIFYAIISFYVFIIILDIMLNF